MGVEPKIGVFTPQIIHFTVIGFPLINHPFWGTTIFGNTPIGSAKPHISLTFNLRTLGRLPATKSYLSFLGKNLGQINTGWEL